ncbi:hypothetical protein CBQ26_15570 [Deinococcus indicus]|uniref:N-acetyltransferase domain-containing protein n=1 Tax=Deinococcus indicus TaxID=223556 RepID=A0A246BI67_9DEIO|nr:GNAT family N-acetyltransferase [Deinococcus indicus]OWL94558.1 hypothetical protein CBQ26_15570 [Deinococcus indicus]GHG23126.1 hypothetical protein GCM10017784_13630 [Deinococcus indicus]
MTTRLVPLSAHHEAALLALTLPPEQRPFTTHPADLLPDLRGDPQRRGVTILDGDEVAGLFALSSGPHCEKCLSEPDPHAVAVSSLSIDTSRQGRGVGTAAMRQLPSLVPSLFPEARRVVLVVNQRNPAARRVYEKAGFTVTGERQGPVGAQWVMTLALAWPPGPGSA